MNVADVQWGNLAEWLAALFTGGAFLATVLLLRGEMRARAATEEDRRRKDADRVAAWWSDDGMFNAPDEVAIHVRNAGETPVYDAVTFIGPVVRPGPPVRSPAAGYDVHFGIVPPDSTQVKTIPAKWVELDVFSDQPDEHGFYPSGWVELAFTDSSGRFWRRTRRGELVQRKGRSLDA